MIQEGPASAVVADSMPANIPKDIFGMVDRGYRHFLKRRGLSDQNYANNSSARHAENKRKRLEAAQHLQAGSPAHSASNEATSNDKASPPVARTNHKTRGPKPIRRGSSLAKP
jgi:hypothetical protein